MNQKYLQQSRTNNEYLCQCCKQHVSMITDKYSLFLSLMQSHVSWFSAGHFHFQNFFPGRPQNCAPYADNK